MSNTPMKRTNWVDGDWVRLPMSFGAGGGPAIEVDTGFVLPKGAIIHPDFIYVEVVTADAAITVDVGILSTQSGGDADGLIAAISVATAGIVKPAVTITQGTNAQYISASTYGILMVPTAYKGANTAGHNAVARLLPFVSNASAAQNISYTVLTASDTFVGYLHFRLFQMPLGGRGY